MVEIDRVAGQSGDRVTPLIRIGSRARDAVRPAQTFHKLGKARRGNAQRILNFWTVAMAMSAHWNTRLKKIRQQTMNRSLNANWIIPYG